MSEQAPRPRPGSGNKQDFPWWLAAVLLIGGYLGWRVVADDLYFNILSTLMRGVQLTVVVTLVSFFLASALGLGLAMAAGSRWIVVRQTARFYIEVVRGIPIIVLLLYVAFVLAPALVELRNWLGDHIGLDPIRTRNFPLLWRAIIALMIAYSAFISEVFRAGLQSVDPGQIEAAKALGLSRWQRFRLVVFPQAIRTILPPLGNDFVALVKDSSLVSVLGVADVTQLGKLTAVGNFRYFETYNVVALIYLTLTIGLSLALRRLEKHLRRREERR
ncbi:amino acid ABC transporter permease [Phaeobacter porticola]|uniref:Amino acid ABC transporter, permease protein n=1 Tax=Phaeobacter porticola TaxID=1844006 RepID=A0A1L3I7G8_9RHOB|nr:amino acid ABC transporter permease [Phaeobacter porticola]APG47982.1 amino acid ABC transporter, permease protein [Phaeobacter porticola]